MGYELFVFYLFGAGAPLSIFVINLSLSLLFLLSAYRLATCKVKAGADMKLFAIFLLAQFASAIFSGDAAGSFKGVRDYWALAAGFVAAYGLSKASTGNLRKFQLFLAVSSCAATLMALTQFFLGTDFHRQRLLSVMPAGTMNATGFFSHHLTFAGFMGMVFLLFSAFMVSRKKEPLIYAGSFSALACLLLSQSRGYLIAAVAALPLTFFHRSRKFIAAALAGLVVFLAVFYFAAPARARERIHSLFSMKSGSFSERVYLFRSGVDMFLEKPVLGWGPGQYEKRCESYKKPYSDKVVYPDGTGFKTSCHAHNSFLMVLVESGIVGLAAYIAFLISLFLSVMKHRDPCLKAAFLSILAYFLVGGLFEYNLGDAEVVSFFSFMMGLSASLRRQDAPEE